MYEYDQNGWVLINLYFSYRDSEGENELTLYGPPERFKVVVVSEDDMAYESNAITRTKSQSKCTFDLATGKLTEDVSQ